MGLNVYTNCSVLGATCFLYEDIALITPVANGKYSDGAYVFDVTGGTGAITSVSSCSPSGNLDITVWCYPIADGTGRFEISANSTVGGTATNVNTNVTVRFTVSGDLGGYTDSTIVIASGTSCIYDTYLGATAGESVSAGQVTLVSIVPSSSGSQFYYSNGGTVSVTLPC